MATGSAANDRGLLVERQRTSEVGNLACPLCGGDVGAHGCPRCHLSAADIDRHRAKARRSRRTITGSIRGRFLGLLVYAGMVAWSWWFMPTVFLFVLPGAIAGAYFHVIRGRVISGALVCFTIVVIVPLLLVAAGLTGLFADVTGGH
jgi:hypothetical protein